MASSLPPPPLTLATTVAVRRATYHDLPAMMEIENASFLSPWPQEMVADELSPPWSRFWVAARRDLAHLHPEEIVAFCLFWHLGPEIHLLILATHPQQRRQGLARLLLEKIFLYSRKHNVQRIYLEVRASNLPAKRLYFSCGFRQYGRSSSYYPEPNEEALFLEYLFPPDCT